MPCNDNSLDLRIDRKDILVLLRCVSYLESYFILRFVEDFCGLNPLPCKYDLRLLVVYSHLPYKSNTNLTSVHI